MRKFLFAAMSGALIFGGAALHSSAAHASGPALFTRAQVSSGGKTYGAQCSKCHGANLEGVSAPALRGDGSGLAGDTVGEAYTFISTQMPAGNPGSLSTKEYANVTAYILSRNGHAPGTVALTPALAKSSKIKI